MKKMLLILLFPILVGGCHVERYREPKGNTQRILLPPGEKLIDVAWKVHELWYMTEPMEDNYVPKEKTFRSITQTGMLEAAIIFVEQKGDETTDFETKQ